MLISVGPPVTVPLTFGVVWSAGEAGSVPVILGSPGGAPVISETSSMSIRSQGSSKEPGVQKTSKVSIWGERTDLIGEGGSCGSAAG
jgi:hypothetical protein